MKPKPEHRDSLMGKWEASGPEVSEAEGAINFCVASHAPS